jgi:hypothetical protein
MVRPGSAMMIFAESTCFYTTNRIRLLSGTSSENDREIGLFGALFPLLFPLFITLWFA